MKILVVDCDPVGCKNLVALLSAYGACETAFDGARAFDMFIQAGFGVRYDLLVVDVDCPKPAGEAFVRKIQQCVEQERGRLTPVPILMVTGNTSARCIPPFCNAGRENYCLKPLTEDSLRWALAKIGVIK